jgi:ankyrin repeat protein
MNDGSVAADLENFHEAIRSNNGEAVKAMLDNGISPNAAGQGGATALYVAATAGLPSMIDLLVGAGAEPNRRMSGGPGTPGCMHTALNGAALSGNFDCVDRLLALGADASVLDGSGQTAAHLLIETVRFHALDDAGVARLCNALQQMLDQGLSLEHKNSEGRTVLYQAVAAELPSPVITWLLERGADPYAPDNGGYSPLHYICSRESTAPLEAFLAHGVKIDIVNANGDHPLHIVYREEIFDLIMTANPHLDVKDRQGATPLARILEKWSPQSTKKGMAYRLIEAGASLDEPDFSGITPREIIRRDQLTEVAVFISAHNARTVMGQAIATARSGPQ